MKVRQRTDRLYEAVEKGLLSLDPTLTERAHKLGAQRQAILTEITGIKREQEIPLKAVAERHVDGFCRALKEKLLDRASSFGKEYLKLLVDRIEVQRSRVSIRGSYSALALAVKTTKRGEPARVPSFGGGWFPGVHDLRTITSIKPITYGQTSPERSPLNDALETEKTNVVNKPHHIIHKAMAWKNMLDDGQAGSLSEIAEKEGLTRARVTQIMNLLKLPPEWREFLLRLENPKEIREYSERRLRNYYSGGHTPPPIMKKLRMDGMVELPKESQGKHKQPPRITLVEIDEPLPHLNLEAQKELIKKAALRKLKKLEDKNS